MKNLAIIPARSGSKGLKDKNVKLLNGEPLLKYSIDAALKSELFDEIMVSTDSEIYAKIAVKNGANVPFLRDLRTSGDNASSWDTVREVLYEYRKKGTIFDTVTLLQPTSPLRTEQDIIEAFSIFNSKSAKAVISLTEVEHSPLWCNTLPEDNNLCGFINADILKKNGRQSLKTYYRVNGAIYIVRLDDYEQLDFQLYEKNAYAYIMPQLRSIDIDNEIDFKLAELIISKLMYI